MIADVVGFIGDAWQRAQGDLGRPGADKGKCGKYVLVPPGYQGKVPKVGYFVVRCVTYNVFCLDFDFDSARREGLGQEETERRVLHVPSFLRSGGTFLPRELVARRCGQSEVADLPPRQAYPGRVERPLPHAVFMSRKRCVNSIDS